MVPYTRDSEIIQQCLTAAANGPFFPDWEIDTLLGLGRDDIRRMAERWPVWDDELKQSDAVDSVLNGLLGYPHGQWVAWNDYISAAPDEVAHVYSRWRGGEELDTSNGYFDRLR